MPLYNYIILPFIHSAIDSSQIGSIEGVGENDMVFMGIEKAENTQESSNVEYYVWD